jgi:hypothetical protein
MTKTTSEIAARAAVARIAGDLQPRFGPCTSAKTSSVMPSVALRAPSRSKRPTASTSRSGGITAKANASAIAASGTLTKNTASHPSSSVNTPPSRTPITSPAAPAPLQTPMARFRSSPSAKLVLMTAKVDGKTSAPPNPCTTRPASRTPELGARPPASEPPAYSARPATRMRRRPSRSEARPPSRRKPAEATTYALITDCSVRGE